MSDPNIDDAKKLDDDENPQVQVDEEEIGSKETKDSDFNVEMNSITPQKEEEMMKKKYGGLLPKKPPLISKDHERAFFDSADWALGKKNKRPLEALLPKLEPTHHHQVHSRRVAYAHGDNIGDDENTNSDLPKDQTDLFNNDNIIADTSEEQCSKTKP